MEMTKKEAIESLELLLELWESEVECTKNRMESIKKFQGIDIDSYDNESFHIPKDDLEGYLYLAENNVTALQMAIKSLNGIDG